MKRTTNKIQREYMAADAREEWIDNHYRRFAASFRKKIVPCDVPDYIAFRPYEHSDPYGPDPIMGWYYTWYDPETGAGHGIFGTPEDPQYTFYISSNDGILRQDPLRFYSGCFRVASF